MTETEARPLDVSGILQSAPQYKPITVDKDDDLKYDLGHLSAFDYHPINSQELKSDANFLTEMTRDNVQLLFTKIFQLPSKVEPEGVLAELPKASTSLPRSKPLPEAREPTRWEKFAKIKGIQKKSRKPQLVWDEEHKEWRRRFGYKRANNELDQIIVPADENDTSGIDPFTKMVQEKKDRLQKQGKKEKRNRDEANLSRARSQAQSGAKLKDDISRTFALVSRSTASLGRFDKRLPGETEAPKMKGTRRVAGVGSAVAADLRAERSANLTILDKMIAKEDKVDKEKAASQANSQEFQAARKRNYEAALGGKLKANKSSTEKQKKKPGKR